MKGETVILELCKSEREFLQKVGGGMFEESEVIRAILFAGMTLEVDVNGVENEVQLTQRVKCALKIAERGDSQCQR